MATVDPPVKEDYVQWRTDPVTKFFVQAMFNQRENYKEFLAEGHHESERELHEKVGACQAIKDAIDYALNNFNGDVIETERQDG